MESDTAPERLKRMPSWLLGQLSNMARGTTGEVLIADGLHRSQYALMAALEEFGPLSQIALSERSGLDRSDIVGWVDGLVERELVRRDRDQDDRRRNVVTLTTAGRRKLKQLDGRLGQAQDRFLDGLSVAERRQLTALLAKALRIS